MPQLTIVSFNAHAGLQPRRDGRCAPYDLVEVLRRFDDADVIVLQESFIPDDEPAAVQKVAAELGAQLHELPLGRGSSTRGRNSPTPTRPPPARPGSRS